VLAIFRQRYLTEESVTKALVALIRQKFPTAALERLLYFHSVRADRLLRDAVIEILVPMRARGLVDIRVPDFQRPLTKWVNEGKTTAYWSEPTIIRIAQGLLSALRDFGVLQGAVNKKIAPAYFPIESFAYVVFYLRQRQSTGAKRLSGTCRNYGGAVIQANVLGLVFKHFRIFVRRAVELGHPSHRRGVDSHVDGVGTIAGKNISWARNTPFACRPIASCTRRSPTFSRARLDDRYLGNVG
jgi:hypothetical protein